MARRATPPPADPHFKSPRNFRAAIFPSARHTQRHAATLIAVSKPLRVALVVLGLAMAVYGVASLTGGWLGTPPWWKTKFDVMREQFHADPRNANRFMQGSWLPSYD